MENVSCSIPYYSVSNVSAPDTKLNNQKESVTFLPIGNRERWLLCYSTNQAKPRWALEAVAPAENQ